jgi:hypothetical protein
VRHDETEQTFVLLARPPFLGSGLHVRMRVWRTARCSSTSSWTTNVSYGCWSTAGAMVATVSGEWLWTEAGGATLQGPT